MVLRKEEAGRDGEEAQAQGGEQEVGDVECEWRTVLKSRMCVCVNFYHRGVSPPSTSSGLNPRLRLFDPVGVFGFGKPPALRLILGKARSALFYHRSQAPPGGAKR